MSDELQLTRRGLLELLGGATLFQPGTACTQSASQDLDFVSALQAAEAIRNKRVSSVELTRQTFERIDRLNPQLNAFVYQLRDEALAQARKADDAQSGGESLGVFTAFRFT